MDNFERLHLPFPGRFLPYGYTVPTEFQECLTWQIALQWMSDNLQETMEKVEALDPEGDYGKLKRDIAELQEEVASIIGQIDGMGEDLTEVQSVVSAIQEADFQSQIDAINEELENLPSVTLDDEVTPLSNHAVKSSGIYEALQEKLDVDVASETYATKQEVSAKANSSDVASTYATKQELTTGLAGKVDPSDLDPYATTQAMETALLTKADVSDLDDYATKQELTTGLAGKVDNATLNDYATTSAMNTALAGKVDNATLNDYATTSAMNTALASKADASALADYATTSAMNTALADKANTADVNTALAGKQNTLTFDSTPTANSTNPVTSEGIKSALDLKANISDIPPSAIVDDYVTENSSHAVKSSGIYSALQTKLDSTTASQTYATKGELNGKQDTLTFDSTPTSGSANPVTSGGVYTALSGKQNTLTFDNTPTTGSTNPVTSGGLATALSGKMNDRQVDTTPTADSNALVTSGGVATALAGKANSFTTDATPTLNSTNPVQSGGVATALATKADATETTTALAGKASVADVNAKQTKLVGKRWVQDPVTSEWSQVDSDVDVTLVQTPVRQAQESRDTSHQLASMHAVNVAYEAAMSASGASNKQDQLTGLEYVYNEQTQEYDTQSRNVYTAIGQNPEDSQGESGTALATIASMHAVNQVYHDVTGKQTQLSYTSGQNVTPVTNGILKQGADSSSPQSDKYRVPSAYALDDVYNSVLTYSTTFDTRCTNLEDAVAEKQAQIYGEDGETSINTTLESSLSNSGNKIPSSRTVSNALYLKADKTSLATKQDKITDDGGTIDVTTHLYDTVPASATNSDKARIPSLYAVSQAVAGAGSVGPTKLVYCNNVHVAKSFSAGDENMIIDVTNDSISDNIFTVPFFTYAAGKTYITTFDIVCNFYKSSDNSTVLMSHVNGTLVSYNRTLTDVNSFISKTSTKSTNTYHKIAYGTSGSAADVFDLNNPIYIGDDGLAIQQTTGATAIELNMFVQIYEVTQ